MSDRYLQTVNHTNFRVASRLAHICLELLVSMGMTKEEARDWMKAWISGAGDGIE